MQAMYFVDTCFTDTSIHVFIVQHVDELHIDEGSSFGTCNHFLTDTCVTAEGREVHILY